LPMDSWEKIANACIARKADGVPFSDQALLSLVDSYSGRSSPGNPVDSLWEPSSLLSWLERAPQQQ
jgi:hypothetical protein